MVPMWSRAWRFANVYAYAAIDLVYTVLWFAAFVAVSTWNSAGIRAGDKSDSSSGSSCAAFGYGSPSRCKISEATVGIGVIICLLFGLTSAISVYGVVKYRRTGILPNGNTKQHGRAEDLEDSHAKDAWSTNTDELDPTHPSNTLDNHHEAVDPRVAYGQTMRQEDEQGLLRNARDSDSVSRLSATQDGAALAVPARTHEDTATQDGFYAHPGRPLSYGSDVSALTVAPPSYSESDVPSALSPAGYGLSPSERVFFPEGHYGNL